MKVQVLVAFLATVALCTGHIGGGLIMPVISPQIYCGRNLAVAISELCLIQRHQKRSEGNSFGTGVPPFYKEDYGWPWLPLQEARRLAVPTRGKRLINGIVDECCEKACSMEEMLSYCN